MKGRKKVIAICCLFLAGLLGLCGCSSPSSDSAKDRISDELVYESSMELEYAKQFSVDYYKDGYRLLATSDGTKILVIPEGKEAPKDLKKGIIVMQQPVQNLYLVSSSVMDIFDHLDALDSIRFSSQKEEDWYIERAKKAMARGDISYAGKYSKPDYERIVSEKCTLAIENMMISHTPEVREMLEDFGIPVMIEYSSYEKHPLGRVEWVRFFGTLLGKEKEAEKSSLDSFSRGGRKFRAISPSKHSSMMPNHPELSKRLVQVRQSSDYIPKMIELAGGRYIFEDLGDEEVARSTVNMQIEDFYQGAKDADYLIYNSTIDGGVSSIEELLDKCEVLKDFKAVKNGDVWCTTNDMYQQSMSMGYLMQDIHSMLLGENEQKMKYLFQLK